jgi:hypothetical protein
MVRTYSGVWVAGTESDTSIAFGYAAETYVDFGLPWMFLPVLFFGLFMGILYRWLLYLIWHRELAIGLATVVGWLSLYLFERSWVKWLGSSITMVVFLGGVVFVLDRWLWSYRRKPHVKLGASWGLTLPRAALDQLSEAASGMHVGALALGDPAAGYLEWPLSPVSLSGDAPSESPSGEKPSAEPEYRFPPPPWA